MKNGEINRSVNRLEQALRMWEELLFLVEALYISAVGDLSAKKKLWGAVVNWRYLRRALLSRRPICPEQFEMPPDVFKEHFLSCDMLKNLPTLLHEWNTCSRRIYTLSEDLQRSLEITSIGSVRWDNVHFPFPIFGVSLPIPIICKFGDFKDAIDFVVVKKSEAGIHITCMGKSMDNKKFISQNMRERITKALAERRFGKVEKCLEELYNSRDGYYEIPPTQIFTNPTPDGTEVMKDLQYCKFSMKLVDADGEITPSSGEVTLDENMQLVVRLVVGLCLHLELSSLRNKKKHGAQPTWEKNSEPITRDNTAITDAAMICNIPCSHVLSDLEREVHARIRQFGLSKALKDMPVHFRSGYWRRMPGKGNDPDAPQCVEVHWTMVNEHRLPPNAVPAGSEVLVK